MPYSTPNNRRKLEPVFLIGMLAIFCVGIASFINSAVKDNSQEDLTQNLLICALPVALIGLAKLINRLRK